MPVHSRGIKAPARCFTTGDPNGRQRTERGLKCHQPSTERCTEAILNAFPKSNSSKHSQEEPCEDAHAQASLLVRAERSGKERSDILGAMR